VGVFELLDISAGFFFQGILSVKRILDKTPVNNLTFEQIRVKQEYQTKRRLNNGGSKVTLGC
jgi:hypothetical protein